MIHDNNNYIYITHLHIFSSSYIQYNICFGKSYFISTVYLQKVWYGWTMTSRMLLLLLIMQDRIGFLVRNFLVWNWNLGWSLKVVFPVTLSS